MQLSPTDIQFLSNWKKNRICFKDLANITLLDQHSQSQKLISNYIYSNLFASFRIYGREVIFVLMVIFRFFGVSKHIFCTFLYSILRKYLLSFLFSISSWSILDLNINLLLMQISRSTAFSFEYLSKIHFNGYVFLINLIFVFFNQIWILKSKRIRNLEGNF